MKVSELIKKLQEFPQDMDVKIFDWRKNLSEDSGDGSSAGIYDLEISSEGSSEDEIKHLEDVHGRKFKPFVQLSFKSDDYSVEGVMYNSRK